MASTPFASLRLPRHPHGGTDWPRSRRLLADHGALALALLGLAWLSISGAGIGRVAFLIAFASAVPLYLVSRAWRLPWWFTAIPAALPLSHWVVALLHWDVSSVSSASRLGYGVVLLLGATAWASTPTRRLALGVAFTAIGLEVLICSVAGWIAAGSPIEGMIGSLGPPNQTAMLLIAAYCIAVCLSVSSGRGLALYATITAGLLGSGVLLTNSRSGLVMIAVPASAALAIAIAQSIRARNWRWGGLAPVLRWATGVVVALLVAPLLRILLANAFGMSGAIAPTAGRGDESALNPLAGVVHRGGLADSWSLRLAFWRAALAMGADHPLTGGGLGSFAKQGVCYAEQPVLWHPHNEWLYAWAQGGLLALVPLVGVVLVGVVVLALRALRPGPDARTLATEPVRIGALVALILAVVHLTTEYDLSYLALLGSMALSAALVAAPLIPAGRTKPARGSPIVAAALVGLVLVLSALGVIIDPRAEFFPWTGPVAVVCDAFY